MTLQIIPFPQEFRPLLPTIVGNVDYLTFRQRLEQIDSLLRDGGVEEDFVRRSLAVWNPEGQRSVTAKEQIKHQQRSRRALRCTILRTLVQEDYRGFSCQLAGNPLYQWFCQVDALDVVRVPSKSVKGSVLTIDTRRHWSHPALMPRKLRIEYEGAIYHVMNRGDRREPIFRDDVDRNRFLETLGEACAKTGWQVHALCLMGNHFHLVVETPQANLVVGMKWLLGTYTARFNRRHQLFGHVFSGRYKALLVDAASPGYFHTVCEYVHLNPARAKLLAEGQALRDYVWSSYPEYLKAPTRRWPWLRVDRLLGEMGLPKDSRACRREFEVQTEDRRRQESGGEEWAAIRRGWFFGADELKKELLAQASERVGAQHYGAERQESGEAKAERLVREELSKLGWTEAELGRRRKGDEDKVQMARRLRRETTMTLAWIATRLQMGVWTHVSNLLRSSQRAGAETARKQVSVNSED